MSKDTVTCPYCSTKGIDVIADHVRPHTLGKKEGADVCDGGGLHISRLTPPAGDTEDVSPTGAKGDKS